MKRTTRSLRRWVRPLLALVVGLIAAFPLFGAGGGESLPLDQLALSERVGLAGLDQELRYPTGWTATLRSLDSGQPVPNTITEITGTFQERDGSETEVLIVFEIETATRGHSYSDRDYLKEEHGLPNDATLDDLLDLNRRALNWNDANAEEASILGMPAYYVEFNHRRGRPGAAYMGFYGGSEAFFLAAYTERGDGFREFLPVFHQMAATLDAQR